ncbi:S1C family serine protease [Solirubrobacter soli]|uniref:S1C family serine protease n=1 Tax=Solirubrobacter soli TaxID=363832 RepID=UPI0004146688|nr:trypsin-like peptidase domain-containing protein [Solirubrobacter soli]
MRRLALACAVVLLAGCGDKAKPSATPAPSSRDEVVASIGAEGGFDAQKIYTDEAPGVVTVLSQFGSEGGEGSGFVLNDDGEIVTNAHVVTTGEGSALKRASAVYVEFADGNRVGAKVLGTDPNADVALLRVDTKGLTLRPLPLGDSEKVSVGEPVAAIGSPFGQAQSMSVGIVSAVDRSVASLTDFAISGAIQTDAAINPGNSGGPLVGSDGRVIGINQQIQSRSGGGEGVGFAVPIDVVKRSVGQLRDEGRARYAYLGVSSVPLYPQLVEHFGLKAAKGVWVQQVVAGGPAAKAGVRGGNGQEVFQGQPFARGGDVITKVGDLAVTNSDDLATAIAKFKPGDKASVEIHRGGETKTVQVELGERPDAAR